MKNNYVVFQGAPITLKRGDVFAEPEIVLSPKISSFLRRTYVGFAYWDVREATSRCWDLFSAWQVVWLMERLKYVRFNEYPPYGTVSDLVEVLEKTIEQGRQWDRLIGDFDTTDEGLRALFNEARTQHPSAYDILSIWPKLNSHEQSGHLAELKKKVSEGVIEKSHLLSDLIRTSDKETARYLEWERKWELEKSDNRIILEPEGSLSHFLRNIGVKQLVDTTGNPYAFSKDLDEALITMLSAAIEPGVSGPVPLDTFVKDSHGVHHPNFRLKMNGGKTISGRLLSLTWRHHSRSFFLALELEGHQETVEMSIQGLNGLGTPKREARRFWQRFFSS